MPKHKPLLFRTCSLWNRANFSCELEHTDLQLRVCKCNFFISGFANTNPETLWLSHSWRKVWQRWAWRKSTELTTVPGLITQSFRTNRAGCQHKFFDAMVHKSSHYFRCDMH